MSKRDHYLLSVRNEAIRKKFYSYLANGVPTMQAYFMTAEDFYLSVNRVRDIVAKRVL